MRYRGKYEAVPVRQKRKKGSIHLQMMVTSAVSFVLCCSMLLGTTMAWFTDTITIAANQISIGELKVDVLYKGNSLRNTSIPVFGGTDDTEKWSPGSHRIKELVIQNQGTLDLNYALTFLAEDSTHKAFQYFDVYVKMESDPNAPLATILEESNGWTHVGTLAEILSNENKTVFNGRLNASTDGNKTQEVWSIALVMPLGVQDASIQGANLTLNIRLNAYQVTAVSETTAPPAETEAPVESGQTE